MKLPNQTRGPVSLMRIDYAPKLSEETLVFVAVVAVSGGRPCRVSNRGNGGGNEYGDVETERLVCEYAKTLPPIECFGTMLPMSEDILISEMVQAAIKAQTRAKYLKKGFTHVVEGERVAIYVVGAPNAADIAKARGKSGKEPQVFELKTLCG